MEFYEPWEYLKKIKEDTGATQMNFAGNGISRGTIGRLLRKEAKFTSCRVEKLITNIEEFLKLNHIENYYLYANEFLSSKRKKISDYIKFMQFEVRVVDNLEREKIIKEMIEVFTKNEEFIELREIKEFFSICANLYEQERNFQKEKDMLEQILRISKNCNTIRRLTLSYLRLKKYESIINIYNYFVKNNKYYNQNHKEDLKAIHFNVASAYKCKGIYELAIKHLDKVKKFNLNNKEKKEYRILESNILYKMGRNELSEKRIKRLVDTEDNELRKMALMNLGIIKKDNIVNAGKLLEEANEIIVDNVKYNDDNKVLLIENYLMQNKGGNIIDILNSFQEIETNKDLHALIENIEDYFIGKEDLKNLETICYIFSFDLNLIKKSLKYLRQNHVEKFLEIVGKIFCI